MQSNSLISILLPYRNAVNTLPECLESIRAQTHADYELLCLDDGSNDGSTELVAQQAAQDPRMRLLSAPTRGLVAALNHGLAQARAPLVARMDADDLMHPRRLELQFRAMQRDPEIAVLASRVKAFPESALSDGFRAYIDWQNACITADAIANDLYLEAPLAHPSTMLRRDLIIAAGGYLDGDFPEDYELWLRLHHIGHRITKLPQCLLNWQDHQDRLSRQDPRYARGAFDRLRVRYLSTDPRLLAARDRLVIWGAGRNTRRRARLLVQQGFRPLAWIDIDPRKIGNRPDGMPVVEPAWLAGRQPKPLVLNYVTVHGARTRIEAELARLGYFKGRDYLHVG
ncbi:MAG: hypothetical protein N838_01070 [Thiohalocapsa sp. PB-PSB1]|nr:MAG: hypothetical protein N838_01070 [Thiohalocapsa sp. PB-PSB1]